MTGFSGDKVDVFNKDMLNNALSLSDLRKIGSDMADYAQNLSPEEQNLFKNQMQTANQYYQDLAQGRFSPKVPLAEGSAAALIDDDKKDIVHAANFVAQVRHEEMRLDLIEDLKTAYALTSTLSNWPDDHRDKKIQDNLMMLASGNTQNATFDNENDQRLYKTAASFDEVKNRINDKLSNFLGVQNVQIYDQDLDIVSAKHLSDDWIKTLSQNSVQTKQLHQTSLNTEFEEAYRVFNNTDKYDDIKTTQKPYVDKRTGTKHYDGKQTWAASNFLEYHSYELKDLQAKERGETTLPSQNKPFALKDETGSYISDENGNSLYIKIANKQSNLSYDDAKEIAKQTAIGTMEANKANNALLMNHIAKSLMVYQSSPNTQSVFEQGLKDSVSANRENDDSTQTYQPIDKQALDEKLQVMDEESKIAYLNGMELAKNIHKLNQNNHQIFGTQKIPAVEISILGAKSVQQSIQNLFSNTRSPQSQEQTVKNESSKVQAQDHHQNANDDKPSVHSTDSKIGQSLSPQNTTPNQSQTNSTHLPKEVKIQDIKNGMYQGGVIGATAFGILGGFVAAPAIGLSEGAKNGISKLFKGIQAIKSDIDNAQPQVPSMSQNGFDEQAPSEGIHSKTPDTEQEMLILGTLADDKKHLVTENILAEPNNKNINDNLSSDFLEKIIRFDNKIQADKKIPFYSSNEIISNISYLTAIQDDKKVGISIQELFDIKKDIGEYGNKKKIENDGLFQALQAHNNIVDDLKKLSSKTELSPNDKEKFLDRIAKNFDIFEQSLTRDSDGVLKKDKNINAKNYETALIDGYLAQTLSDSLKHSFQEAQKQEIINIDELSKHKRNDNEEEANKSIYERLNGINEYVTKVFDKVKDFMQNIANKLCVGKNNENQVSNVEFSI